MKTTTKITTAIVLTIGLIGGGAAYAGKGGMKGGNHAMHAEFAVMYVSKKLDLDTTQEQALTALKDQILVAKSTVHDRMETTHDDMKAMITADTFDQGKALQMLSSKTATIESVAPEVITAMGNFLDTLNAEQKQDIVDFMNEHHGKGKRGHWRH